MVKIFFWKNKEEKFKYFHGIYVVNRIKHAQKFRVDMYVQNVGRNSEKVNW